MYLVQFQVQVIQQLLLSETDSQVVTCGQLQDNLIMIFVLWIFEDLDENMVMQNKKCILNYHKVEDPWDVDNNGIFRYVQTQVTNEQVIVVDDYCITAGTDTNFPWTNQFGLDGETMDIPFLQEVTDTRWMVVCFQEPVFNLEFDLLD